MKKIISIIAVLVLVLSCFVGCQNNNDSDNKPNNNISSGEEKKEDVNYTAEELLDKVISKAIEIDPDTEYGMKTLAGQKNVINLENLEDILGLTEEEFNENIDGAMESKPDDTWSPHSVVFVKVKDGVDTESIAKKIVEKTSPYRFGCLKPDVIVGAYYENYIVIIDSDEAEKEVVLTSLKDVLGAEIKTIDRENDWNFSFFEE